MSAAARFTFLHWAADEAVGDIHRYTSGGFHLVRLGDVISAPGENAARRYRVLHKLGHGSFATVCVLTLITHAGILVHNVVGSLLELSHTAVGKNQAKELCRQITTGLGFLHRNGIAHGSKSMRSNMSRLLDLLDLYVGDLGFSLPNLVAHSEHDILDLFGSPECCIVLPREALNQDGLPPYPVPPISLTNYVLTKDPEFADSLHVEIMDLGNGT
ncbi:hypothetical protein DFH08DRAFT_981199 [Mycena albidolilacea]|uniref:Protein kinase domain-containing protein n=1 Tax=Mycena albidolilacea TaxID=1033008 RepID=A0AAD7AU79_9AGAR|nr:hypothetical protein DFH08DRAFT_981199 [Mycena albidolilacea]